MNMSFVIAVPDLVEVAAQDLAGIRSSLDEVTEAIVAPTTSLVPAAQDEVSAAIARLFGAFGQEYQALNAEVAAFHNAFVNAMTSGAAAYLDAEIGNGAALLSGGGSLTADVGAGLSGLGAALSGVSAVGSRPASAVRWARFWVLGSAASPWRPAAPSCRVLVPVSSRPVTPSSPLGRPWRIVVPSCRVLAPSWLAKPVVLYRHF
jgi:PE family